MPRWIRGTLALILVLVLIGSIGDLLASNIERIINLIPRYSKIEDDFLNDLEQNIGMEAIQILNGNYIEPRIMGKLLNLSPLVVVLYLTIWGSSGESWE